MISSDKHLVSKYLTEIISVFLCSTNRYAHDNNNTIKKTENIKRLNGIDIGCIADYGFFL